MAEPILPKFNLSNNTRIANVQFNTSLPNATLCTGTHTIVYSKVNKQYVSDLSAPLKKSIQNLKSASPLGPATRQTKTCSCNNPG